VVRVNIEEHNGDNSDIIEVLLADGTTKFIRVSDVEI